VDDDPSQLSRITIPVLLLYETESTGAHIVSVNLYDEQLPDSRIYGLSGLGHLTPEFGSKPVADALAEIFTENLEK